jgi:hypothetical protein
MDNAAKTSIGISQNKYLFLERWCGRRERKRRRRIVEQFPLADRIATASSKIVSLLSCIDFRGLLVVLYVGDWRWLAHLRYLLLLQLAERERERETNTTQRR